MPETYFLVTAMQMFGKLIPITNIYVCNIFWLECMYVLPQTSQTG